MTKEELEKEAKEKARGFEERKHCRYEDNDYCGDIADGIIQAYEQGALDFAEPREKRIEELEKENAELKEQISTKDILIKELQEQKAYWKESSFDWRHKFFKKGSTKRLVQKDKQLTKAKEIIKKLYAVYYDPCVTESDLKYRDELFAEIKQFISEVEK